MRTDNNLKTHLAYVCKKGRGYISDLRAKVDDEEIERFESVGFITKGHTLKDETWRKTKLADNYFKEMYGWWAYLRL